MSRYLITFPHVFAQAQFLKLYDFKSNNITMIKHNSYFLELVTPNNPIINFTPTIYSMPNIRIIKKQFIRGRTQYINLNNVYNKNYI